MSTHPDEADELPRQRTHGAGATAAGPATFGPAGQESWDRNAWEEARPQEARTRSEEGRSTGGLVRQLVDDVAILFRKELALAASEITHSVEDARRGVGSMVSGGAVLYAGVLFLLASAALGLMIVMPAWAALLVVGGVVALIGLIMLQAGRRKLSSEHLAPDRTAESLRKDRAAIRRHAHDRH